MNGPYRDNVACQTRAADLLISFIETISHRERQINITKNKLHASRLC